MNDLVSVVVPIYNVEQYLDRCVESIVNQTYKNLEIILVDDGSPDNCPQICDNWAQKDSRIKVIHKKNAGAGKARNAGLEIAYGDYIMFVDSDDYIDTTVIEKCLENMKTYNSQVVVFGRNNVYTDTKIEPQKIKADTFVFKGSDILTDFLPYIFTYELGVGVGVWGRMYDLNVIRQSNLLFLSEREIASEDSYFSLELFSKISTVTILNENLYFYRTHETSLSRRYVKGRQKLNDEFLTKCLVYINEQNLNEKIATHIKARYHGFTLGTLMQISRSELTKKDKRQELYSIYRNKNLTSTLTSDVISLDYKFPRLFWRVLKLRLYPVCSLLLNLNKHR